VSQFRHHRCDRCVTALRVSGEHGLQFLDDLADIVLVCFSSRVSSEASCSAKIAVRMWSSQPPSCGSMPMERLVPVAMAPPLFPLWSSSRAAPGGAHASSQASCRVRRLVFCFCGQDLLGGEDALVQCRDVLVVVGKLGRMLKVQDPETDLVCECVARVG
jgi:hypothetical protein